MIKQKVMDSGELEVVKAYEIDISSGSIFLQWQFVFARSVRSSMATFRFARYANQSCLKSQYLGTAIISDGGMLGKMTKHMFQELYISSSQIITTTSSSSSSSSSVVVVVGVVVVVVVVGGGGGGGVVVVIIFIIIIIIIIIILILILIIIMFYY